MRKISKRSAVIAGVSAVIIGGGAAAFAANGWTIGGKGSAEAEAAKIQDLSAEAVIAGKIYPGVTTKITAKVTNPNDFPVKLTAGIKPTDIKVTPQTPACINDLVKAGPDVIKTDFPGAPVIPAKGDKKDVESQVTIGDLPQSCAGLKFTASYTFNAVSTV